MIEHGKDFSTKPSKAAFSAVLAEWNDSVICRDALKLEMQCMLGRDAKSKKIWKSVADRGKTDAAAKTFRKGLGRKRPSAANRLVGSSEAKLAETIRQQRLFS